MNWTVDKDAPENEVELAGLDLVQNQPSPIIRRRVLLIGFFAGLAVGILNLAAVLSQGKLGEWFGTLDQPLLWMFVKIGFDLGTTDRLILFTMLFLYWGFIGLGAAWVICVVRSGVVTEAARGQKFRRSLYLGAIMGMLVSCLNGLVIVHGLSGPEHCFETLDWPAFTLLDLAQDWFPFLNSVFKFGYDRFLIGFIVLVCYWLVVGMSLMACLCVIRALVKRRPGKVDVNGV